MSFTDGHHPLRTSLKNFLSQAPVKICVSILLIETILLSVMGVFYVRSFNREIDQRVLEKLTLPGILMSQRALNYDSVNNHQIIGELIQEAIIETFITKENGEIFYAADDQMLGKPMEQFFEPKEHLEANNDGVRDQQITFKTSNGDHFRSSLSQIRYDARVLGYLYIKIDTNKIVQEKRNIILLFLLGSLLTIFLTTLFEAFYIHRLFVPRINSISTVLNTAEKGDLSARVHFFGPKDELNTLIHQVNRMLNTVSETIDTLTDTQVALKASEERFKELSDLLPEGVFELDSHGSFTYVNLQLCKELLYNSDEFYRKLHFTDLLSEEDLQRSSENFKERLDGRLNGIAEYNARRKDGSVFPVMINATPIGEQGQPAGVRGILVNLTEKNRILEQLWQTQKMDSIGRLSASVAHEFGNPLMGIKWLLMDIQKFPDLDDSKRKLVGLGLNECQKMQNLITDFQAFVKPSSGEKMYHDINLIVDNILLLYKKYFADKKVSIEVNYQKNLPLVPVVKDQIHQVLVNLIMNSLHSLQDSRRKIFITTLHRENQVLAIVEDTGCGIAKKNMDHIFEPFFSTKPEAEGTGLGLYVSYMIIKKHYGEIHVESEIGKGSTLTFSLPVEGRIN